MSPVNSRSNDTPTPNSAAVSKRDKRMLGLRLHDWELIMIGSLFVAAFAAVVVFVSNYVVVKLQRIEVVSAADELERYKEGADIRIAEANTRGEEAKKEAAQANERAAEANEKAEKERLDRVKIGRASCRERV